ncbi:myeloid leukemia factor 2-like isoform X4 [Amphiura filiformis]|uniref:myeloid leukemia factor 2-like isoform X4 n=1 Tax=Amphiura filiformis TaxID=82378 RepID=UPI003B2196B8
MFGSGFRHFEDDPFFRDIHERHRQQMSMMGSMFSADPFFSAPTSRRDPTLALEGGSSSRRHRDLTPRQETRPRYSDPFAMSPFGMMDGGIGSMFGNMQAMMGNMHQSFERMANDPNSHSYSSTSVMSYSNTGEGAPKVYQASSSTRQVPGGVKETRRTVRDSEKGVEKMAIGHHLGDRAHIIEKARDARTGQVEENQEFLNLDESEAPSFNREFTTRTRGAYPDQASLSGPMRSTRRELPALTDSRRHPHHHHPYLNHHHQQQQHQHQQQQQHPY